MDRRERYLNKIKFIWDKIENLPDFRNELERDACLYRIQVAIESAMDIVAMLVKDFGEEIKDDYSNLDTLVSKKVLDNNLGKKLKELNGLRNVVVHKYNQIEEEVVEERRELVVSVLKRFTEKVEDVIKKIL